MAETEGAEMQTQTTESGSPERRPNLSLSVEDSKAGDEKKTQSGLVFVDASTRKLYLGGYRHTKTGVVFHHATTQTPRAPSREWEGKPPKFHRDTQTVENRTRSAQTTRESGTQMVRRDVHLDVRRDREVKARPYFSASQLHELKLRKAVVIQCYWRGHVARETVKRMRAEVEGAARAIEEAAERKAAEEAKQQEREVERRMHPRSAEDFEVLYNELETWRYEETQRVNNSGLGKEERLAALAQLLHKETKLLQIIDRLKLTADKENRDKRVAKMLELMATPKQWANSDGQVAAVHTPFTIRAKELAELYNGLNLPLLSVDERLDVLLHVKWTVKEFDCALTREIVELIDREADLLNRGRGEKSLQGLRKRLSNLFLQFVETPEFNPESSKFQKVPQELLLRPAIVPISGGKRPPAQVDPQGTAAPYK